MSKVFRRDCLTGLTFEANRFDFDWELAGKLVRRGYVPIEIPVNYQSRSFSEGKKVRFVADPLSVDLGVLQSTGSFASTSRRAYASSTIRATRAPMASDDVSPGESIPATCTTRGVRGIATDQEIRERLVRRAQLRANAGTARLQVGERDGRQQRAGLVDEARRGRRRSDS